MSRELKPLLDAAERARMTPQQKEEQRRSFAFGDTAIENDRITRELVDSEAERLTAEEPYVPGRKQAP
jgi:hypothetical protein